MRSHLVRTASAAAFSLCLGAVALAIVRPPAVNSQDFKRNQAIDNAYLPQPAGTLFIYDGVKDGIPTHDEICVTSQTKPIQDVRTRVVHHESFEGGALVETTFDWFAQDVFGNVWYFGEDTTDVTTGSKEGSWESGVNGAQAGFIMLAKPEVGDRYYQELSRNVAEDQAKVLSLDESVCLASGKCYDHVLQTQETSRLDPGVVENKYHAPSVGFILGVMVKGGNERTELTRISTCSQ